MFFAITLASRISLHPPSHNSQECLQIVPEESYSTPCPWEPLHQIEMSRWLAQGWDFPGNWSREVLKELLAIGRAVKSEVQRTPPLFAEDSHWWLRAARWW